MPRQWRGAERPRTAAPRWEPRWRSPQVYVERPEQTERAPQRSHSLSRKGESEIDRARVSFARYAKSVTCYGDAVK